MSSAVRTESMYASMSGAVVRFAFVPIAPLISDGPVSPKKSRSSSSPSVSAS